MRLAAFVTLSLACAVTVALLPLAGAQGGAETCMMGSPDEALLCPPPTVRGASCIAHGLLVLERDSTGALGDVTVDHSQSRVWTWAMEGPWQPPQQHERLQHPTDPSAHADATQLGVQYANPLLGVSLSSRTVFSDCDVIAWWNPEQGLYSEAYGRAGAEDVTLGLPIGGFHAEALDREISAIGLPWITMASQACDVVEVSLVGSRCPYQNAGFAVGTMAGTVSVTVNENWGPVPNAAGQWVYGGAALHVEITTATSTVDIFVGYVSVAVTGGPPMPAFCIPDPILAGNCAVGFPL